MSSFNFYKSSSTSGSKTLNSMLFSNNRIGSFNRIHKFDNNILANNPRPTTKSTNTGIKLQFSIENLKNFAYEHSPVVSMSGTKPPLREIITIEPLINLNNTSSTPETYYLTYIYYNVEQTDGTFAINGYGYLTYSTHDNNSVRAVWTVSTSISEILSGQLFYPDSTFDYSTLNSESPETLFLYNNHIGETVALTLTIENGIVTIESQ
jgi:hypothetical protein